VKVRVILRQVLHRTGTERSDSFGHRVHTVDASFDLDIAQHDYKGRLARLCES
jgi:hypothetical protein